MPESTDSTSVRNKFGVMFLTKITGMIGGVAAAGIFVQRLTGASVTR